MKIHLWMMLTILWGGLVVAADEVPKPLPDAISEKPVSQPMIILPMTPVLVEPDAPTPIPAPLPEFQPKVISDLGVGMLYVIESQTEIFIEQVPLGVLEVEENQTDGESLRVNGVFADGPRSRQWRTFKSSFVYILSSDKPGKTELLLVPSGLKSRKDIVRQSITVTGEGPRPPPGPGPTPEPGPVPDDPPAPVSSFRVIFVKESGATLNAAQSSIPAAKVIRDYLVAKTTPENGQPGWREYDPDQATANEQPTMQKIWEAVKPKVAKVPCLVIEVNGHATVMPFPASVDECMATLKKAGGE